MIYVIAILILIILILIIMVIIISVSAEKPCVINKNFEREFLQKLQDPEFLHMVKQDPKFVLENELSQYLGQDFRFSDDVRVKVIEENVNDLYIMVPNSLNSPTETPLEQIIRTLNEKETYGLFMGSLEGFWWRFGLHTGSCVSDIKNEIETVKHRTCLICT